MERKNIHAETVAEALRRGLKKKTLPDQTDGMKYSALPKLERIEAAREVGQWAPR